MDVEELNKTLKNPISNVNALKGFEIIGEALVYKVYDLFGRNLLLSMLYQVGAGPGEIIAERLKSKFNKEYFEIMEALEILMQELKEFYSIQIKDIEKDLQKIRIVIENYCFLREPFKHRQKLKPGKAFCRINKGYFETAFKKMLGDKVKAVEINFLRDDAQKGMCVEELIFYL